MKLDVLREAPAGETRVALVPESVRLLVASGVTSHVEGEAWDASGASAAD